MLAASLAMSLSLKPVFLLPPSSTTCYPVVSQSIWCCNTVGLLWPHFPRCICSCGLWRELMGWGDCGIDQPSPGVRSAQCGSEVCPNSTHHWLAAFHPSHTINPPFSVVLPMQCKVCLSDGLFCFVKNFFSVYAQTFSSITLRLIIYFQPHTTWQKALNPPFQAMKISLKVHQHVNALHFYCYWLSTWFAANLPPSLLPPVSMKRK